MVRKKESNTKEEQANYSIGLVEITVHADIAKIIGCEILMYKNSRQSKKF